MPTPRVTTLRSSRPPCTDPPFTDEDKSLVWGAAAPMIGNLALPIQSTRALAAPARRRDHLHLVPQPGRAPAPAMETADTQHPAGLPEPGQWCRALIPAVVEVLSGNRPLSQIASALTPRAAEGLRRRLAASARNRSQSTRPVVRSVHVSEPAPGVVEACATVHRGRRSAALALRAEAQDGRWRITVIQPGWAVAG